MFKTTPGKSIKFPSHSPENNLCTRRLISPAGTLEAPYHSLFLISMALRRIFPSLEEQIFRTLFTDTAMHQCGLATPFPHALQYKCDDILFACRLLIANLHRLVNTKESELLSWHLLSCAICHHIIIYLFLIFLPQTSSGPVFHVLCTFHRLMKFQIRKHT